MNCRCHGLVLAVLVFVGLVGAVCGGCGRTAEINQHVLNGCRFVSTENHETGLGPDGVEAMGPWFVSFEDGKFHWEFSDASRSGLYTLAADGTISAESLSGFYDADEKRLEWEGFWYKLQDADP